METLAIGVGLAVGLAGLGVGIGQGIGTNGGLQAIARQPESGKMISSQMLIGLVFMELVFLLSFVIGFLLMNHLK